MVLKTTKDDVCKPADSEIMGKWYLTYLTNKDMAISWDFRADLWFMTAQLVNMIPISLRVTSCT